MCVCVTFIFIFESDWRFGECFGSPNPRLGFFFGQREREGGVVFFCFFFFVNKKKLSNSAR